MYCYPCVIEELFFRRDFRLYKLNQTDPTGSLIPQLVMWVSESVQIIDAQHYSYSMDNPSQGGWAAFFIQVRLAFTSVFCILQHREYSIHYFTCIILCSRWDFMDQTEQYSNVQQKQILFLANFRLMTALRKTVLGICCKRGSDSSF